VALLIDTDMLIDLERGVVNPEVENAIGDETARSA
jgi:predicted nucleic acid-binding protein